MPGIMRLFAAWVWLAFVFLAYSQSGPGTVSPGLVDIVKLSQAHLNDSLILTFATNSAKRYKLSTDDLLYLKDQGVSQKVISALVQSGSPGVAPSFKPSSAPLSMDNPHKMGPKPSGTTSAASQYPEAQDSLAGESSQKAQSATAATRAKANTQSAIGDLVTPMIATLGIVSLLLAIPGTILGLKEKVVIYNGHFDFVLSCIIPVVIAVAILDCGFADWGSWGLALLSLVLLLYSVGSSF